MRSNGFLTITISSPHSKKPLVLSIRLWTLYVLAGVGLGAGMLGLLALSSSALGISMELNPTTPLSSPQKQGLLKEVDQLKKDVEQLLQTEDQLKTLLEDAPSDSKKLSDFQTNFETLHTQLNSPLIDEKVREKIPYELVRLLKKNVHHLQKDLGTQLETVAVAKTRFNTTPSIWPLSGPINSGFGMRFHPLLKSIRFHHGIDITAWSGSPIKVTADGRVTFAGWTKDYGYTVIVDHARGLSTLYGHASHLLIRPGQRVRKGQLIAQVGSTGLSTGSHLHYEIRRWNIPIRPEPFLSLNLFTARSQVW